ncbi:MAG: DJ-1/PfpI family protein [Leifsonia sp.]
MHSFLRRACRVALAVTMSTVTLAAVVLAGFAFSDGQTHTSTPALLATDLPANRPSSDGRIVVAVALGATGTVGSDVLAPYDVFASSPDFSVYTVAVSSAPASIDGGPSIVPTFTFADVDSGRAPAPDVVVVPAVGDPYGSAEAPLRDWIVRKSNQGAHILGVCSGSMVLAETGLLDGLDATSHWSRIAALQKTRPQVNWVTGQRYVRAGAITTSAGVTSGIPGALNVMAQLDGAPEAQRVGALIGYPDWSLDGSRAIPVQSFNLADLPVGLNPIAPWLRPTIGVGLADGVSEIDVASAFEVYNMTFAARAVAVSAHGTVTTKHGMVLVTDTETRASSLSTLIVPGATSVSSVDPHLAGWAKARGIPVDALHGPTGATGFDGALEYFAAHTNRGTAMSAAKMIDYPTAGLELAAGGSALRAPIILVLSILVSVGVGMLPTIIRRVRRRGVK